MTRLGVVQDRAIEWILAREEPSWSDADQVALEAWLDESDLHRIAFLRLEQGWREADRIGALGAPLEPETLRVPREASPRRSRKWWIPLAMAASLAGVLGIGWQQYMQSGGSLAPKAAVARYDTQTGERETVALSDGSRIELNTASVVRASVKPELREVWLDRGEAYFEIAHDQRRPFVVHAGDRQVTVLGTKFSVRRDGAKVTVLVREGKVRVDDVQAGSAVRSTTITGGDIAIGRGSATLVTGKSQERVESGLAWREGMLSFDQERLSDIAAEFNRYNSQQMIVTDAAAADIRIGGMFPASKPRDFVRLLRDAYGLKVRETATAIHISS